eukprot:TRINITY_DN114390_c0_g1_i1.p1 TRINITY_DN114390_c0_g1~~TRINITY_DN114390_c0_g1_i1.p1  ORF type:complete len:222 (-),score=21.88 TRINITY_DN114390_c0_g1_i1:12-677(-)
MRPRRRVWNLSSECDRHLRVFLRSVSCKPVSSTSMPRAARSLAADAFVKVSVRSRRPFTKDSKNFLTRSSKLLLVHSMHKALFRVMRYALLGFHDTPGDISMWDVEYLQTIPHQGTYHLEQIAVSAEARGKGVGKNLLHWVGSKARERGCDKVALEVISRNNNAKAIYEKTGYVDVSRCCTQCLPYHASSLPLHHGRGLRSSARGVGANRLQTRGFPGHRA